MTKPILKFEICKRCAQDAGKGHHELIMLYFNMKNAENAATYWENSKARKRWDAGVPMSFECALHEWVSTSRVPHDCPYLLQHLGFGGDDTNAQV